MATSSNSDIQKSFLDAIRQQSRTKQSTKIEWWRQRLVTITGELRCTYCDVQLNRVGEHGGRQRARLDFLVPLAHGGPKDNDNLAQVCHHCRKLRRSTDLVLWRPPTMTTARYQSLLQRRMGILMRSQNHLLRDPSIGRKKGTVVRHLERRWAHPRVPVWAALTEQVGLFSLSAAGAIPDELVAMTRSLGALPFAPYCFHVAPDRFHDLAWALIDHNALIQRIELPGHADRTPDTLGDAHWHNTYSTVLDIRRRRPKLKPIRRPAIERPMDWGQRLLIEFRASGEQGRPYDWAWINEHRSSDIAWTRVRREEASRRSAVLSQVVAELGPDFSRKAIKETMERRLAQRADNPGDRDALARLARDHGI